MVTSLELWRRLHRATLYYRLDRIRQVFRINLNDGGERPELHVWLKLMRLRGRDGAFAGTVRRRDDVAALLD